MIFDDAYEILSVPLCVFFNLSVSSSPGLKDQVSQLRKIMLHLFWNLRFSMSNGNIKDPAKIGGKRFRNLMG